MLQLHFATFFFGPICGLKYLFYLSNHMEMRQKTIVGPILIVLIILAWTINIGLRKKLGRNSELYIGFCEDRS